MGSERKWKMKPTVKTFLENHADDDILYAATIDGAGYFGLSGDEMLEVCTFIFKAIADAKEKLLTKR